MKTECFFVECARYSRDLQVTTEVDKDEAEARQEESDSSDDDDDDEDEDPSESMFNDHSSDSTVDVGCDSDEEMEGKEEDRGKSDRLVLGRDQASHTADGEGRGGDRGGAGAGAGAESVNISGGEKKGPRSKRCERLEERVIRAVAQCQACLYGVALVPCAVS